MEHVLRGTSAPYRNISCDGQDAFMWMCSGENCHGETCTSRFLFKFDSFDEACSGPPGDEGVYFYCDADGRLYGRNCDGTSEQDFSDCEPQNLCDGYSYSYECEETYYLHNCKDDVLTRYDCGTDYTCSDCVEIDEWIHISHAECVDDDPHSAIPWCDGEQFYFKSCGGESDDEPATRGNCLSQGCLRDDDDESGHDNETSSYPYNCFERYTCDDGTLTRYMCSDRGCQDCTVDYVDDNPTCDSEHYDAAGRTLTLCYGSKVARKSCSDTDPEGLEVYVPGEICESTMCKIGNGKKKSKKHDDSGIWIGVGISVAVLVLGIGLWLLVRFNASLRNQRKHQVETSSVQMLTKSPMAASQKPAMKLVSVDTVILDTEGN